MSPQFVDFDADGQLDIVAAIFDGSPKIARGTAAGFLQPVHVLDRDGQRIVMNQFWNYDSEKWEETRRCDPTGVELPHGHLTSAWACDWDLDGDLDLLLGDHDAGQVLLRINDGTTAKPAFATSNTLVHADGKPLVVPGTVTTLRLFDCTGDGRDDLVVGSMGAVHGGGAGGAVYVYPDEGDGKERRLGAPLAWVQPSKMDSARLERPDTGLHMEVLDHDGDGDLDLVVGGYSHWIRPARELTDEQQARVTKVRARLAEIAGSVDAIYAEVDDEAEAAPEAERKARRKELLATRSKELEILGQARLMMQTELEALVPVPMRRAFVWLYENVSPPR